MNLYDLTVAEAMSRLATGDITSEALTRSCLDRIDQVDGEVGAFITLDSEGALEQARNADLERKQGRGGALCGIPVAIKDLLCTKDMRTTCGSQMLADFIPPYDATVVEKIRGQGGVILGKASMDEFAMGSTSESCAFVVPHNPWKKGYVAGSRRRRSPPVNVWPRSVPTPGAQSGNRPRSAA